MRSLYIDVQKDVRVLTANYTCSAMVAAGWSCRTPYVPVIFLSTITITAPTMRTKSLEALSILILRTVVLFVLTMHELLRLIFFTVAHLRRLRRVEYAVFKSSDHRREGRASHTRAVSAAGSGMRRRILVIAYRVYRAHAPVDILQGTADAKAQSVYIKYGERYAHSGAQHPAAAMISSTLCHPSGFRRFCMLFSARGTCAAMAARIWVR